MRLDEKYNLLNRLGLIGDTYDDFVKRVEMNCEWDESYNGGMWDLANELASYFIYGDKNNFDELNDLLYTLLKY